jgi:hypothetical protein
MSISSCLFNGDLGGMLEENNRASIKTVRDRVPTEGCAKEMILIRDSQHICNHCGKHARSR